MKKAFATAAVFLLFVGTLEAAPEEIINNGASEPTETAVPVSPADLGAGALFPAGLNEASGDLNLGAALTNGVDAASARALPSAAAALARQATPSTAESAPTPIAAPEEAENTLSPAAALPSSETELKTEGSASENRLPAASTTRESGERQLAAMTARLASGVPGEEASALGLYDGNSRGFSGDSEEAVPANEILDVYFGRDRKKDLTDSAVFSSVHLMDTSGRRWHWGRFRKGAKINVRAGSHTAFVSLVEGAATKSIGSLTKADLAGVFPARTLNRNGIANLRKRLIKDLARKSAYRSVGLDSIVRVVRFLPFTAARQKVAENTREETFGGPVERPEYQIAPQLSAVSRFLPKVVVLDLSLFPNGIPPEIIEDMNKLMNAGVYFILTTGKPLSGPGSAEEVITGNLSPKQKDKLHRYKMLVLADDGNVLASYDGQFPKLLPMSRFDQNQLDVLALAAQEMGVFRPDIARSDAFAIAVPQGEAPAAFAARYETALQRLGFSLAGRHARIMTGRRGPLVVLRPADMGSAIAETMSLLRVRQQLYVNPGDIMVISRDQRLLTATEGSSHPAVLTPGLSDQDAAGMAFAALLPQYRANKPGDLAASASMISSFLQHRNDEGGRRETVEMFLGHVMHSAFNWAVWRYRNTGVFPSVDETVAQAKSIWDESIRNEAKMLALPAGQTMSAYYEDIERLKPMHTAVAAILKDYPIILGTELPNLFVVQRYKGSQPAYRDIFRLVYDFAAARETEKGFDVVIVDFKTGKTPTNQKLDKDIQPQLYEWVVRQAWEKISKNYGSSENMKPVGNISVRFVYPTGAKEPAFNEWGRMRFEKSMKGVLKRIRKAWNVPLPGAKAAAVTKKSSTKKSRAESKKTGGKKKSPSAKRGKKNTKS